MHTTLNTHEVALPRGPIVDLFVDELERRIRERLKQRMELLFIDIGEVDALARDIAEAVMG